MKPTYSRLLPSVLAAAIVAMQPTQLDAASPTLSEMLEKGIYAEETKGDLDGAISIYQELVVQSKASQAFAAQAHLRLGQCLLKKNRTAEAFVAFEKVIREY